MIKSSKYLDLTHEVVDIWNVDSEIIVLVSVNGLIEEASLGSWIKCVLLGGSSGALIADSLDSVLDIGGLEFCIFLNPF